MNMEPKRDEIEPEVVPKIQPSPPSKAVSTCSGEMSEKIIDNVNNMMIAPMAPPKPPQMMLKTPENQSMAKSSPPSMRELKTLPMMPDNTQHTIEKKPMYSSVNLLTDRNMHGMYSNAPKPNESCFSANVKLGLIQLVLSILLSAFGGLLIAKQASLSMLGSGVWSGIFAGICGALGLFNIQPLMNGFLACSLISIATSTTALAFTGIGLVRDYNFSQTDPVSCIHCCGCNVFNELQLCRFFELFLNANWKSVDSLYWDFSSFGSLNIIFDHCVCFL